MPELPEVETVRSDLERRILGKTIQDVEIRDLTLLTGHVQYGKLRREATAEAFRAGAQGRSVDAVLRRGKYLILKLSGGHSIVLHLRMTGQLLVRAPERADRAAFTFSDGSHLCFADRRRFGEMLLTTDWEKEKSLRALGIEPLNGEMTPQKLRALFRGRKASIHGTLLNQSLVCGLGNIYVAESLFFAGIRPSCAAGKIPLPKLELLCRHIREVLERSIEHRGYSMNTYVDTLGKKGRSQMFSRVYGKEGKPCPRCRATLKRTVLTGRGVVFCPSCQK